MTICNEGCRVPRDRPETETCERKNAESRDAARIICRSNYLRRLLVEASASFARLTRWYVTRRCRVSTWNITKQREREREERFRLNWFLWRQRSRGKNLIWMWFDSYFLSLSIFNFHRRWKIEGKLPNNELPNREKISKLAWKRSDRRPATLNERQRRVENRTPRYGGNTRFRFNDPKNFSVQQKFKQNQARQFANVLELPWNYERNQIERVCERERERFINKRYSFGSSFDTWKAIASAETQRNV